MRGFLVVLVRKSVEGKLEVGRRMGVFLIKARIEAEELGGGYPHLTLEERDQIDLGRHTRSLNHRLPLLVVDP